MTNVIDRNVVEMSFENDKFERGVSTSLSSIDKLKNSLKFDKATDAFYALNTSASKVNLSSISDSLSSLSNKFSALGITAITVFANIVNSAFQTAKRLGSALTVDPIRTGLDEYETKLNSIQTILANTQREGTNLEIVTRALNELNAYSDKTIYNFREMARNIGTFTAAGVKLDTSVAAIKGIANLAAISGSNSQQASTAMYQLSQALSTGSVKLMDWNSVVNAGMGGQVFQDAVKETARVHGVAIDKIIQEEGSFRDSLQKGWFTSEILTETLAKFTGDLNEDQLRTMGYTDEQIAGIIKMGQTASDAATKVKTFSQLFETLKEAAQSGWGQTWEIIIGDFNEAKEFLTELNNIFGGMIGASADARNKLFKDWKDLGGRHILIDALRTSFDALLGIIKPITEALRDIFPPVTARQLQDLSLSLLKFSKGLVISGDTADKIKRIFKGVFAVLDIGRMLFSALVRGVSKLTNSMTPAVGSLTDFLAAIGDWLVGLRNSIKAGDFFNKTIDKIGTFISGLSNEFTIITTIVKEWFKSLNDTNAASGITKFIENLGIRFAPLASIFEVTGKFLKLLWSLFKKVTPVFVKLGSLLADSFGSFLDGLGESLNDFDPERFFDFINGGLLSALILSVNKFISKGTKVFDGITDILDNVQNALKAWTNNIKADTLLKIAAALGILALSILVLASIDPEKLTKALLAITTMFVELGLSLSAFEKISATTNVADMAKLSAGLIAISTAMLIMSLAVSKLGKMEPKELIRGLAAIVAMIGTLSFASKALSKSSGQMIKGATALIIFSFAIRSLTKAVMTLGAMDDTELTRGLIGTAALIAQLGIFMKTMNLGGLGIKNALGLVVLAGAIAILTKSVVALSEIGDNALIKGLVGIGAILTELSLFVYATAGGTTLLLTAAGIGVIAIAMLALTKVMEQLSKLSWEEIGKGLTGMAGALLIIAAASYALPPTLIFQAAGLVVMASALLILGEAMTMMGKMSWDEIGRGLTVLTGALLGLTSVVLILASMPTAILGATALLVAAGAMMAMAPALLMLGSMSWAEIGRGLAAFAGMLTLLGIAGALLTPVIPTLLGLGLAMTLIGAGAALAGIGVFALSAGLAALAASGTAGAVALVTILTSIFSLLPMIVKQIGKAILNLVDVLVKGAPTLLDGIVTLLSILITGLDKVLPNLVKTILNFVEVLLTELAERLPTIVQAGYDILLALLGGLRDNIGEVITVVYDIVKEYLNAIATKLPELAQAGFDMLISFIDGMTLSAEQNVPRIMDSLRELGWAIVRGIVQGLIEGGADLVTGVIELAKTIIDTFKEVLGIHSPSSVFMTYGKMIILGLVNGLKSYVERVISGLLFLINLMRDTIISNLVTFYNNGISIVTKLRDGIIAMKTLLITAAKTLVDTIITTVKSKFEAMKQAGKDLIMGFLNGITEFIINAEGVLTELANAILATIIEMFDIQSPSRVMYGLGELIVEGLVNGIANSIGGAVQAASNLADNTANSFSSVISRISNAMSDDLNFEPSIRPVIDFSSLNSGMDKIDSYFQSRSLGLELSTARANTISANQNGSQNSQTTGLNENPTDGRTIQFVQNNYSPSALDRIEIYRQTRNQLKQVGKVTS